MRPRIFLGSWLVVPLELPRSGGPLPGLSRTGVRFASPSSDWWSGGRPPRRGFGQRLAPPMPSFRQPQPP
eukprot:11174837-Lingulodinium_polyedra.AAC.1